MIIIKLHPILYLCDIIQKIQYYPIIIIPSYPTIYTYIIPSNFNKINSINPIIIILILSDDNHTNTIHYVHGDDELVIKFIIYISCYFTLTSLRS